MWRPVSLANLLNSPDDTIVYLSIHWHARLKIEEIVWACNAIYSRVGSGNTSSLLVSLLSSNCTPILLYGTDATCIDSYEFKRLWNSYDRAFTKIFGSFDCKIVLQCQWYSYCLGLSHTMDLNGFKFVSRIYKSFHNNEDKVYHFCNPLIERSEIMDKYGIRPNYSSSIVVSKLQIIFVT